MLTFNTINQQGQDTGSVTLDEGKLCCATIATGADFYRVYPFGLPVFMASKTIFEGSVIFGNFTLSLSLVNPQGTSVGTLLTFDPGIYTPFTRWKDTNAIITYENLNTGFVVDKTQLQTALGI